MLSESDKILPRHLWRLRLLHAGNLDPWHERSSFIKTALQCSEDALTRFLDSPVQSFRFFQISDLSQSSSSYHNLQPFKGSVQEKCRITGQHHLWKPCPITWPSATTTAPTHGFGEVILARGQLLLSSTEFNWMHPALPSLYLFVFVCIFVAPGRIFWKVIQIIQHSDLRNPPSSLPFDQVHLAPA